jgi:hypothetical protein
MAMMTLPQTPIPPSPDPPVVHGWAAYDRPRRSLPPAVTPERPLPFRGAQVPPPAPRPSWGAWGWSRR